MKVSSKSYYRLLISFCLLLFTTKVFSYEAISIGEAFSTSKAEACRQALDNARESAAQQARVYVSSKFNKRIKVLSGEVVESVTEQTYQSTFGITELDELFSEVSIYDEESGRITCHIEASFTVDSDAVTKELEARIRLEEAKIEEANRKSKLLAILNYNEASYGEIQEKASQYSVSSKSYSDICKERYSVKDCKNGIIDKFENEKAIEIANELNIPSKYVNVVFSDFEGTEQHEIMDEYDDAFIITMNGLFEFKVNVSDPYAEENNKIINELALLNGDSGIENDIDTTSIEDADDIWEDSGESLTSVFSNLIFDITLVKGDFLQFEDLLQVGESEAHIDTQIQFGITFDVGGDYKKNLFRLAFYTGNINIHTCLSSFSTECDSFSTIETDVNGIGLEKIFSGPSTYINFGGVYYKNSNKDVIDTDFLQLKLGITNNSLGPFIYGDISVITPRKNSQAIDIETSFDMTIGVGVRF